MSCSNTPSSLALSEIYSMAVALAIGYVIVAGGAVVATALIH